MLLEGNAALPDGCDSPQQIVMAVWRPGVTADNTGALNSHYYLSHPTRSLSTIVCRGQERPKGSKGTLRPDFQANTRPRILKKPMSPKDTGRQLQGNPGIVSLRQFRENEA